MPIGPVTDGAPGDPTAADRKKDRHHWYLRLNKFTGTAIAIALMIIVVVGMTGIIVTNRRAADNGAETTLLGKCIFQATVYRAGYAEAKGLSSGQRTPTLNGHALSPFAGLKLPADITKISLAPCQKYLDLLPKPSQRDALQKILAKLP